MRRALIGWSGFVGGNLLEQTSFDERYRSGDIEEICGQEFDLVVCCGAPAAKWIANKEPEEDRANIERLMAALKKVRAASFVLISTIDVYRNPVDVDEDTPITTQGLHPYGANRFLLEEFVRDRFRSYRLRMPGLFGSGLKKNVIFDLLHNNNLDRIDARSVFQYYNLANLWRDIERCIAGDWRLVNVATEPISVAEVAREAFGIEFRYELSGTPGRYDMRSRYAAEWGGKGGYLYMKKDVIRDLTEFVARERKRLAG